MIAGYLNQNLNKPKIIVPKQKSAVNINDQVLLVVSAGQRRLLSSFFWITTLLESDLDRFRSEQSEDKYSWLFFRFKTIATLEPRFLNAYIFGGKYLNIVTDDLEGSNYIFMKGLETYPDNFELNYNLAYLLAFEMGRFKEAAFYYSKIVDDPKSPVHTRSLIAKLQYQSGTGLDEAYKAVLDLYQREKTDFLKVKYRKDLYAIKAEIDLNCLNLLKKGCSKRDFDSNPYLYGNGKYYSAKQYARYKLFIK
jgi:hypothetical protein